MKSNQSRDYMFNKKAWSSIAKDIEKVPPSKGKTVECPVNVGAGGGVKQEIKYFTVLSRGSTKILRGVSKQPFHALILSVTFLLVNYSGF